jgi:phosphoglycolate phosphatase-like HAD superfamily hydrolase
MEQAAAGEDIPAMEQVGGGCWSWHRGPRTGEAVVFDLDGVLSNAAARQHYLKAPRPDWEAFFSASGEDPPIDEVAALLGLLSPELAVVLLTARPARIGALTMRWLARYDLRWDLLVMRRDGDYRSARYFKQEAVRELQAQGLDLKLCVEDDLRNVEMFRAEGLLALYIHSGYYE